MEKNNNNLPPKGGKTEEKIMKIIEKNQGVIKFALENGNVFQCESCGSGNGFEDREAAISVICLEGYAEDDNGVDCTDWPTDEEISGVLGFRVRFLDSGDNQEFSEALFVREEE